MKSVEFVLLPVMKSGDGQQLDTPTYTVTAATGVEFCGRVSSCVVLIHVRLFVARDYSEQKS